LSIVKGRRIPPGTQFEGRLLSILGRIRAEGAVPALDDDESAVRIAVVGALGRIRGERAVEALIAATDDASPAVRKAVIEALSGPRWGHRVAAPVARPRPDANPAAAPEPN
jgi:ribosomal protein S12 methylthiotransferase accessory factor YcaO